ncbi:MAG: IMP cyclohydrolase [Oscillospiraceae bacterium]|jgi:IMP cyclohydrolase|nr:IMP cyclohydrolase [Oscillospiraceae bacterium]
MIYNIEELLTNNPYPGRGIIIGCSEDSERSIIVYFIMGRSENSRNRIFERTNDGIRTAAYDLSKLTDPSLVIYHPIRKTDGKTIVTNGDQTDTIYDHLKQGFDFRKALQTREFEPDAPNYTPRISALVEPCGAYTFSILKTMVNDPNHCQRNFYEYAKAKPGLGHFISTYNTDGDPLPSFIGEPIPINIKDSHDIKAFVQNIWTALNEENKVSLYAKERNLKTHEVTDIIINKHTGG